MKNKKEIFITICVSDKAPHITMTKEAVVKTIYLTEEFVTQSKPIIIQKMLEDSINEIKNYEK